jgi:hypothetical protein
METKFPFNKWIKGFAENKDQLASKVAIGSRDFFLKQSDDALSYDNYSDRSEDWADLAQSTLDYKARMGYGSTKLVNTGGLRNALVNSIVGDNWDNIKLIVSSDFANFHNEGGINLPKRTFVSDSYAYRQAIRGIILHQMTKIIK